MGRKKISILIENEINNHQIYVPVFYLIKIYILVVFEAKNDENDSTLLLLHANARGGLRGKNEIVTNFGNRFF